MKPATLRFVHPWLRRYGVTALLAVLLASTVAVIGYEIDWGQGGQTPVVPLKVAAQSADQGLLPSYVPPPIDPTYKETVERPLFISTRRPAPEGTAVAVSSMKKGQYKLTGTSINSTMTVAFLVETASGKSLRANKGAEVGPGSGIKVDTVEPTRVILRQGDETEELTLRTAASPRVAPTAMVATPGMPPQMPGPGMQGNGNMPGQFAGGAALPSAPFPSPPLNPQNTGAGMPLANIKSAAEASSLAPPGQPAQVTAPVDPNAAVLRRRRFQNLPQ